LPTGAYVDIEPSSVTFGS